MLGARCCSRCLPFCLEGDNFWLHFVALRLIWVTAWKAWVPFGIHWVREGAQISYLALLCGRELQFEGPGGGGRAQGRAACGIGLHRIAPSCGPYRRIVDQILHHPAWAAAGMSHPGLGCWRHGSSWAAWADALLLGLGF